MSGYISSS